MSSLRLWNRAGVNFMVSALLLLTICTTFIPTSNALAFDSSPLTWKDSGLKLSNSPDEYYLQTFLDTANPNTLFFGISRINGYFLKALNWKNGSPLAFGDTTGAFPEQVQYSYVGNNGYVYGKTESWVDGKSISGYKRFSLSDRTGTFIQHFPLYSGEDGSLITYALDKPDWINATPTRDQSHLWVSLDGGLNWQERGQNLPGAFVSLSASKTNSNLEFAHF